MKLKAKIYKTVVKQVKMWRAESQSRKKGVKGDLGVRGDSGGGRDAEAIIRSDAEG